jgi:hypothetical protein
MDDTAQEILGDDDAELSITIDWLCSFLSMAEKKETDKKTGDIADAEDTPWQKEMAVGRDA